MAVLVVRRVFWSILLTPSQVESLRELISERLGHPPDSEIVNSLVDSFNDGIDGTQFFIRMMILAGSTAFCVLPDVRKMMSNGRSNA